MGQEALCTARVGDLVVEGKASLETDELIFRGDGLRLRIPFKTMKSVEGANGDLTIAYPDGRVQFELGSQSEKWVQKILHPKSLLDKLGVRAEMTVSVVGVEDEGFLTDLRARTANVSVKAPPESDLIFVAVDGPDDLSQLTGLRKSIKPNGAIWAVFRKGRKDFNENDVLRGGLDAGLVDVKVVRFSDTHTASKFVIRKRDR